MSTSSIKPITEQRLEKILDKKLDEKLKDYPTKQYLDEKFKDYPTKKYLDEKLKEIVTQDYLEDRLELQEKGIAEMVDEKIRVALVEFKDEIVSAITQHVTNILKPLGLTVADHEQRITTIEQNLQS